MWKGRWVPKAAGKEWVRGRCHRIPFHKMCRCWCVYMQKYVCVYVTGSVWVWAGVYEYGKPNASTSAIHLSSVLQDQKNLTCCHSEDAFSWWPLWKLTHYFFLSFMLCLINIVLDLLDHYGFFESIKDIESLQAILSSECKTNQILANVYFGLS